MRLIHVRMLDSTDESATIKDDDDDSDKPNTNFVRCTDDVADKCDNNEYILLASHILLSLIIAADSAVQRR